MHFHYLRVSTDSQTVDMQKNALSVYPCDREYIDMGISGKTMDRPQLEKMMDTLRKGDVIYVYSLSRLGRDTSGLIALANTLEKLGVSLVSHTEKIDMSSPMGKFFFTLLASLGQLERELIEERRIQGVKTALANNVRFGRKQKLTEEQTMFVRTSTLSVKALSDRYSVSESTIKRAKKRGCE